MSKKIYYRQEHVCWLLLCWWALLRGGPLCLEVLFPIQSSVACAVQLEVMLCWFLWSGYINWNETAKCVSCQPPNNHQLGLLDKDGLEQSTFVWYAKKRILSFLMTQSPELHPASPSKKKKRPRALMPSEDIHMSAQDYLINSFEVFILNLPHGIVSESNTIESEY